MLQETVDRIATALGGAGHAGAPIIVGNADHVTQIDQQLEAIGCSQYTSITEPIGRNTAPAAALAALLAAEQDPETVLIILPADHHIRDAAAFKAAVEGAVALASAGKVVTYGIVASQPETGYGYIRRGSALEGHADSFEVAEFVEKPNREVAQGYVASGDYYWNGGIFTVRADVLIEEMTAYCSDIISACRTSMEKAQRTNRLVVPDAEVFSACRADSIDYAVMEHTEKAAVIAADMGWNDVGSWTALHEIAEKDAQGNAATGDVIAIDCANTYVRAGKRLVAAVGVEDLVIVETEDAVLVTRLDKAQDVKSIVTALNKAARKET